MYLWGLRTGEPEIRNGLGLVSVRGRSESEAFLREIGTAVEADELLRVGLNMVQYLPKKLVG